jgi:hypothetical protein
MLVFRLKKLKSYFLRIFSHLRHRFWFGGSGISRSSYRWIRDNVERDSVILELGGGLLFTRVLHQKYQLYTIEHDIDFVELFPSNYVYAPLHDDYHWYSIDAIRKANLPKNVELMIVDGPPGHLGRQQILNYLRELPEPRFIMVDDTNRTTEMLLAQNLSKFLGGSLIVFDTFSIVKPA